MNNSLNLSALMQHIDENILETTVVQKKQFELYYTLLLEWNSKINLISRNEKNIVDRHFFNSVCIAHFVKFNPDCRIIDIGSGGGFPGIILKILFPHSYFVLADSITKKTDFLKRVIDGLGLKNIEVINGRAEKISSGKQLYKSFDYVTARAVSSLKDLVVMSLPFLKESGKMVFLKGRSYTDEIAVAPIRQGQMEIYPLHPIAKNQDGVLLVISVD